MRPPRRLVLPAAALTLMVGAAVAVSGTAGTGPAARCHARVRSYLEAVFVGDVARAAALRADGDAWSELGRVRGRTGRPYVVESLTLTDGGREAHAAVLWPGAARETQIWRRENGGAWYLADLGRPPAR